MKEMIYQQTRLKEPEILASGEHKGYNYYVVSLGTHPCGYIEIPRNSKYFNVDYDNIPVECHGGLTYGRDFLHTVSAPDDNRYFIGWDYAHYGDYVGYDSMFGLNGGAIHFTAEIVGECKNVIEQLVALDDVPDTDVGEIANVVEFRKRMK